MQDGGALEEDGGSADGHGPGLAHAGGAGPALPGLGADAGGEAALSNPGAGADGAEGDHGPGPADTAAAPSSGGLPVAAACALAAAAAASVRPGPDGAAAARPGPPAAARSRSPLREGAARAPRGETSLPAAQLGHSMRVAGPYAFCCKCGAFAKLEGVDRAKGLKQDCKGPLPTGQQASAGQKKKRQYLARLLSGKDPYSGKPMG